MKEKTAYIYSLILDKNTLIRAIRVSLIVGVILNIISNPDVIFLDFSHIVILKVLLTFVVPFLVSLYSSVVTRSKLKIGEVSQLNVLAYCKSCKKTEKHFHIGEKITECENCKNKTKWSIKSFFKFDNTEHEMVKSLALFAENNPQPLFRLNPEGIIETANTASSNLFNNKDLTNKNIFDLFAELKGINIPEIIKNDASKSVVVYAKNEYFNFVIKGVSSINTAHIYGNNITDVISAQDKANSMALFAEHNPQPLFRIDGEANIITSNTASNKLFNNIDINGKNIKDLIPKLEKINFNKIIKNDEKETIIISADNEHFNFMIKGVSSIKTAHIYGNNITDVILAQNKIKEQSIQLSKSIDYAWLIQKAMLPSKEEFNDIFADNFVFYRPRDVVSGDFYWISETENLKFLVVADSTGHGVPGAFMSMVGISFLDEIILRGQIHEPDDILNHLRSRIISSLSTANKQTKMSNGMDLALIVIDTTDNTLSYAGAYNPLYIVRNNELLITKANSMPIGKFVKDKIPFSSHKINLEKNDKIYLFTDGYKDQFGGEDDTKYSPKAFRNLILSLSQHSIAEQFTLIAKEFDEWKDGYQQLDDVTVVGIKM